MEYYKIDPVNAGRAGIEWHFDLTKVPQTLRLDLAPDLEGEPVPVAIKFAGDTAAFAQACRYPDGTRVLCLAMLDLRDGLIVRQTAVQEWDA